MCLTCKRQRQTEALKEVQQSNKAIFIKKPKRNNNFIILTWCSQFRDQERPLVFLG